MIKTVNGYQVKIEWSEEDQCYLVSVPELADKIFNTYVTHGDTLEEALRNAEEAIEVILMPDRFPPPVAA